jgi:CubicO group peptidase (beta-lactamase class C family)
MMTHAKACPLVRFLPLLAILAVPLAAGSVPAGKPEDVGMSSERLKRIDQMIQRRIDAGELTGAVTIVARKGKVVHLEAQGVMDLESKKPMAKDTMFRVASMTKPVTGLAIMMMIEEGKVRLTDPVSRYIPEFRGMKVAVAMPNQGRGGAPAADAGGRGGRGGPAPQFYTVPAEREITIRDLLTHTSGLVSGGLASTAEAQKVARKPGETLADYIPRLGAVPLDFQPGTRWSYSPGAGFDTLGRVVEIISGQSYDQFLRQRIFDPLGMKDTVFHPAQDRLPRVATMYHRAANALEQADTRDRLSNTTYFSGAGGLMTDAADYLQFGEMLASGGQWNGKRLLSPKTVELMASVHAPDTLPGRPKGRSFGLSVQVVNDAVAAGFRVSDGSFGWDGAFGTHFWVDPNEKVVGILMIQTNNPNRELDRDFENAVMQAIVE